VIAQPIEGVVQHYPWGDETFIPALLVREPDGSPWAEFWLGTHPNGPSSLANGTPLAELTGSLPYLLKVLAAAEPLSLQVHPSAEQAAQGYERGLFADPHAKPELLVALTRFEALCGIRTPDATLDLLRELGADELADRVIAGTDVAIRDLYRGAIEPSSVIEACRSSDRPEADVVRRLDARYPGEPSVAVTLMLNHVTIEPGEALHLTAGNLHAYLGGCGIELMGASDNVVRGGLTSKPIDVDLLLETIDPTPLADPVVHAADGRYRLPEAGCSLVRIHPGEEHTSRGHEIALSRDGETVYLPPGSTWMPQAMAFVAVPDPTP
jgi:mannose-6-phosphate isomerase